MVSVPWLGYRTMAIVLADKGRTLLCQDRNGGVSTESKSNVLTRSQCQPCRSDFTETELGAQRYSQSLASFAAQWETRRAEIIASLFN